MKVFACDFDKTLYHWGEGIKEEDRKAIQSFQKKGNKFGLCTGRPYSGVKETCHLVDYDFMILCNGAIIIDHNGSFLLEKKMDQGSLFCVVKDYKEEIINLAAKEDNFVFEQGKVPFTQIRITTMEEIKDTPIYMVSLYFDSEMEAAKATNEINIKYPSLVAFQNLSYVDITASGCTKGKGASFIKNKWNATQLYGMGDSYNDIPLLKAVDIAYTFSHSPQQVKNAAHIFVDSVAEALEKIEEN